ncbi:restriction endonuclease [Bradyrhizobium vignae]|uniref:Restriction endonuclease n=1 Tax=Bradyrhizobium vignae TaxID=1549949 RepID=A0ABS3ZQI7_9BRAD|nr:restriction endonuclease [Bradyrhizobium vignae]MBP0110424.1 restriction endonuclease [Bradyrhizobium vignae]
MFPVQLGDRLVGYCRKVRTCHDRRIEHVPVQPSKRAQLRAESVVLTLGFPTWSSHARSCCLADALSRFPGSRALVVASEAPPIAVDTQFTFQFFGRDALAEPDTRFRLEQYAPSVGLLQRIQRKLIQIDDLSWREFEQLIASMLEADGYLVELLKGSKDGGVDVVAIKDLGEAGLFKSVWQAKKHRLDRKVGLSLVRELADTRLEHGASKGIIVTTSFLTSGALERVERDQYLLGKVDRADLDQWIERTLRAD